MISLERHDVPEGSLFREGVNGHAAEPLEVDDGGIWLPCLRTRYRRAWHNLQAMNWWILRPGEGWKPCCKEGNRLE